jgi:hypothetical protein
MSDLRPWVEEGATESELSALSEARGARPTRDARKRMLAGVGVGAALGVTTTTSAAAASTSMFGGILGKALLATAVASALGGAVWQLSKRQHTSTTLPSNAKPAATKLLELPPTGAASVEPLASPSLLPSEVVSPGAPARPASVAPSPSASLSAEVAALERARRALDSKAPREALKELEAYRQRFPRGSLRAEQTVLTVEALLMQGNSARAIVLADRFAAAQPQSPYARRAQDLVKAVRTK